MLPHLPPVSPVPHVGFAYLAFGSVPHVPHVPHSTGSMFSPLVSEEGVHRRDCGGIVGDDATLAPAGKRGKPILNHRLFLPHGGGPGYLLAVDEPRNAE